MALHGIKSCHQFSSEDIAVHQMMLTKISGLPFGIFVFGTRKVITFDFVLACMSILGSLFLLLVGMKL